MSMIALGPDDPTRMLLGGGNGLHLTLIYAPGDDSGPLTDLANHMAAQLPPASGVVSGHAEFGPADARVPVCIISCDGLGARRAELVAHATRRSVPLSKTYDFVPHVTTPARPEQNTPVRFDHLIIAGDDDPTTWQRLPLRGVAKFGVFDPNLHPHGWHGYWSTTGGMGQKVVGKIHQASRALSRAQDIGTTTNRIRARAGSGLAYQRGPASALKPLNPPVHLPPHIAPTVIGKLGRGATVHVAGGSGAARGYRAGKVISYRQVGPKMHEASIRVGNSTRHLTLHETRLKMHPSHSRGYLPHTPAYVDHQALEQWWAGRVGGRRFSPLPRAPIAPGRGSLGRPGRVKKDAMTVSADLGHDGQAPVTVMQGGSRLERCPRCGYKLTSDGHCPQHGNVLMTKEDGPIPSTGEALSPNIKFPQGRRGVKPKPNSPVGTNCNYCGGTDGFHEPWCPRNISDPAIGLQSLGS